MSKSRIVQPELAAKLEANAADNNANNILQLMGSKNGKNIFGSYLDIQTKARLAQSHRLFYHSYQSEVMATELVGHIVRGEKDAVEAMIEKLIKRPNFLLKILSEKVVVMDYSTNQIAATVLQAALGAEDDEMVALLLDNFFYRFKGGRVIALKQWDKQFPVTHPMKSLEPWTEIGLMGNDLTATTIQVLAIEDGLQYRAMINGKIIEGIIPLNQLPENFPREFDSTAELKPYRENILKNMAKNGHTISYDFSRLIAVIADHNHETIEEALALFRDDMKQGVINDMKQGVLTKGKHFNSQLLIDVLDVYVENCNTWSDPQRRVFWSQVVGYIQRFLPANYAQAFCQGLHHVVELKNELKRSFDLDGYLNGGVFYPLDRGEKKLGIDFAVYSHLTGQSLISVYGNGLQDVITLVKTYVKEKQEKLSDLRVELLLGRNPSPEPAVSCQIC